MLPEARRAIRSEGAGCCIGVSKGNETVLLLGVAAHLRQPLHLGFGAAVKPRQNRCQRLPAAAFHQQPAFGHAGETHAKHAQRRAVALASQSPRITLQCTLRCLQAAVPHFLRVENRIAVLIQVLHVLDNRHPQDLTRGGEDPRFDMRAAQVDRQERGEIFPIFS